MTFSISCKLFLLNGANVGYLDVERRLGCRQIDATRVLEVLDII